jgi:hypothetical protein
MTVSFLLLQKLPCLVIFKTKYGVISAEESANANQKKIKSSLEARKMKLEG